MPYTAPPIDKKIRKKLIVDHYKPKTCPVFFNKFYILESQETDPDWNYGRHIKSYSHIVKYVNGTYVTHKYAKKRHWVNRNVPRELSSFCDTKTGGFWKSQQI